jgi:hypothetical protein
MGRQRDQAHESVSDRADKVCGSCGRRIEWRAKWERAWDSVRWCSDACRARGLSPVDRQLEASILSLLAVLPRDATICPSDAARAVAGAAEGVKLSDSAADEKAVAESAVRELTEPARRAARRLVAAGEVEIMQGGRVVDPSTAKGAIRVRRARAR